MKFTQILLVILLSAAVAFGTALVFHPGTSTTTAKETTYARILRTGEIRCGYSSWNPLFYIDPKTNEKLGIFHDLMEEAGKRLGVKIIWQEELGWGTVTESVKNGRVDMACSGYWLNPARIKNVSASTSQVYSPLYVWVRQNDTHTFKNPEELNSPEYTVGNIDGSADNEIIAARFSKAKLVSLPELATNSDIIENLTSGKVDFVIVDAGSMASYMANNPGKVKAIFTDKPMNVFPNVILMPADDPRLKEVIDDIMRNIEYDGTLDAILKKYGASQSLLRNPAPVMFAP